MKTKTIFYGLVILCSGCVTNKYNSITYYTNDVYTNKDKDLTKVVFDIEDLTDKRKEDTANAIFYVNEALYTENGKKTCMNAEKYYRPGTVSSQFTGLLASHLNVRKTFKTVYKNKKDSADYYMTGNLTEFNGKQEYTNATKVGAQFGIIGGIVASTAKTPGKIVFEITDLKIYNRKHEVVMDLGTYRKEYEADLPADSYCYCIYQNVNNKLKDYFTELIKTIETGMKSNAGNTELTHSTVVKKEQ